MDLDEIKRGLRAEIKKRENEQYFTFQCNVRQMCKDVLAKLEEQESVIVKLKADYKEACDRLQTANLIKDEQLAATRHSKYKLCLDNAWCCKKLSHVYALSAYTHRGWKIARYYDEKAELYRKWRKRWLKIAEQFKDKEA